MNSLLLLLLINVNFIFFFKEHCVDQRCERLQWENFYLRTQLEQILQELRQVGNNDTSNFHKPLLSSSSSSSATTRLQQLSKTSISSTTSGRLPQVTKRLVVEI